MSRPIIPCACFGKCAICDYLEDNIDIESIKRSGPHGYYWGITMKKPPSYEVNWHAIHTSKQMCKECRDREGLPLCKRLPVARPKYVPKKYQSDSLIPI